MSELLPLPLTPVTQTRHPRGISTSMFLRLLWWPLRYAAPYRWLDVVWGDRFASDR